MVRIPHNFAEFKSHIFEKYAKNPGLMLLHTGAIGWILSSMAQMSAILMNDKLSAKDKLFLLPQEAGDGLVNIISFYTLTWGIKAIGEKLATSGKLRTKNLDEVLKRFGHVLEKNTPKERGKVYAGDWNFNITKLPEYDTAIKSHYEDFANGVAVASGLTGSILSTNIVTPYARNYYAAQYQSDKMAKLNKKEITTDKYNNPKFSCVSFNAFQQQASQHPFRYSRNLKV